VTLLVYASCHANPERNMLNFRNVLFYFKVNMSIFRTEIASVFIRHLIPLNRSRWSIWHILKNLYINMCVCVSMTREFFSFFVALGIKWKKWGTSFFSHEIIYIYISSLVNIMIDWYTHLLCLFIFLF